MLLLRRCRHPHLRRPVPKPDPPVQVHHLHPPAPHAASRPPPHDAVALVDTRGRGGRGDVPYHTLTQRRPLPRRDRPVPRPVHHPPETPDPHHRHHQGGVTHLPYPRSRSGCGVGFPVRCGATGSAAARHSSSWTDHPPNRSTTPAHAAASAAVVSDLVELDDAHLGELGGEHGDLETRIPLSYRRQQLFVGVKRPEQRIASTSRKSRASILKYNAPTLLATASRSLSTGPTNPVTGSCARQSTPRSTSTAAPSRLVT